MSDVADADSHLRVKPPHRPQHGRVNYLGLSAMTMPVGRDRAGMPVGLRLTAPAGAEERLLAIALAAERVLGTAVDPARNAVAARFVRSRQARRHLLPRPAERAVTGSGVIPAAVKF
jgi:hypothetical protein